jgi:hypothetical protein
MFLTKTKQTLALTPSNSIPAAAWNGICSFAMKNHGYSHLQTSLNDNTKIVTCRWRI